FPLSGGSLDVYGTSLGITPGSYALVAAGFATLTAVACTDTVVTFTIPSSATVGNQRDYDLVYGSSVTLTTVPVIYAPGYASYEETFVAASLPLTGPWSGTVYADWVFTRKGASVTATCNAASITAAYAS